MWGKRGLYSFGGLLPRIGSRPTGLNAKPDCQASQEGFKEIDFWVLMTNCLHIYVGVAVGQGNKRLSKRVTKISRSYFISI